MADNLDSVLEQLRAAGLVVEHVQASGRLVRCKAEGDRGANRAGWYCLHEMRLRNGGAALVGAYGNWRTGEKGKVSLGQRAGLSEEERQALNERIAKDQQAAKAQRERLAERAARRADAIWRRLPETGEADYLERKGVRGYGVRYGRRRTLVVPVRDALARIYGLQVIYPSARESRTGVEKDFWPPGLAKAGHFHLIGEPGPVILVAEGYATAASLHQACGLPVAVAFDTTNLRPVGEALRKAWPKSRLIFCADDDFLTVRPVENPGVTYARAAALVVDGEVLIPQFADRGEQKLTDFNDLHGVEGLDAVSRQVMEAVSERAASTAKSSFLHQGGSSAQSPPASRNWRFNLEVLRSQYVLIYGTETVFDARYSRIVKLPALRAAAGEGLVRQWLESWDRRIVLPEDVLFDPAREVGPDQVNLFGGWPRKPCAGHCEKLLELLHYLCQESDNVFDWVLKWTAYPLQNPGAKMRSAIIMHGPEGTGKNTWWGAIGQIYGEYHGIITQTELENQFNGWSSRKLFIIGNEVVSRQEMYHQKGRIKNMITEPVWMVNEKNMPARLEANHANFVFLSNAHQPATPDPDDRRFLVIWTPPHLDPSFYRAVAQEARQGGIEALYQYLLDYELDDFDEHSKPPMTAAKEDLIEASMDSHERFWRQWRDGLLPIRLRPCLSLDCYRAYRRWCDERGERFPATEKYFLGSMGKRVDFKGLKRYMPPDGGQTVKQKTVLIPELREAPAGKSERQWLSDEIQSFRFELDDWAQGRTGDGGR